MQCAEVEQADEIDAQFWERFDPAHYTHAFTDREYEILNLLYDAEIIGMDREAVLKRFLTGMPARLTARSHSAISTADCAMVVAPARPIQ